MDMNIQNKKYVIPADKFTPGKFVRGYDAYVGQQWNATLFTMELKDSVTSISLSLRHIIFTAWSHP